MANTDLTLINAALTRVGNDPLHALTGGSLAASTALSNYDEIVKAELSNYPWKFATKIAALDLIDADVHGDPPSPWLYAYTLPTDRMDIRAVMVSGQPIPYAVHGATILCDQDENEDVILHYLWRPAETLWPAFFRMAITIRMEAMFLRAIGERHEQAAKRDKDAEVMFAKARLRDSQGQTARAPVSSPTLEARRA